MPFSENGPAPVEGTSERKELQSEPSVPLPVPKSQNTPLPKEQETDLSSKLDNIMSLAKMASYLPSQVRQSCIDQLLGKAGLPIGEYVYSQDLMLKAIECGEELERGLKEYEQTSDKKSREKILFALAQKTELFADRLLRQFISDNGTKESLQSYDRQRYVRNKDAYKTDVLSTQMKVAGLLAGKDYAGALNAAKQYIQESILGIGTSHTIDQKIEKMVNGLAENLIARTQQNFLPILESKIREFSQRGFATSFINRAKQTANFAKDWVATPFDSEAKERMASGLTPIAYMGPVNALKEFGPILRDLCRTAYNVSLSNGDLLELIASLAGTVAFDVALIAATWGTGAMVKATETAGKATQMTGVGLKAMSAMAVGFGAGKLVVGIPHSVSNSLSFSQLEEKVHEQLVRK